MFKNSSMFWNWLVTSSSDPTQVALTVKGAVSTILPLLMIVVHSPSLSSLPDDIYSIVVAALGIVAGVATIYGIVRKVVSPTPAFTATVTSVVPSVPPSAV